MQHECLAVLVALVKPLMVLRLNCDACTKLMLATMCSIGNAAEPNKLLSWSIHCILLLGCCLGLVSSRLD